jgi:aspartyl-tRNA(Asn)/glutamyl-tRNA(Gln) amidotransferase subunit C
MTQTTISTQDVSYIAGLAKIAVSDEEASKLQQELAAILAYVAQLDELDTSGVEPTYQVTGLSNVAREDTLIDYHVSQAELLKNAPHIQDNQIKVPKVL